VRDPRPSSVVPVSRQIGISPLEPAIEACDAKIGPTSCSSSARPNIMAPKTPRRILIDRVREMPSDATELADRDRSEAMRSQLQLMRLS
jgi:hypothetical protein